ncbi:PIG-L deacetylase family protein [Actinomycetospora cinnamomea]|uniref:LmbE family N-acetylglucosaminyl deacetylase n=1 Tax=Actinomycetospora cinnamomea TaxID=663609 RepID=A0A2U1FRR7_9PSEU|nr:PIG-L deacetylase family protein [Actinomycetospora cinnamomea]PVZ14760.1 LmbE family N-acetylglucosaminyl deacetylase [Actinomycetospora cinnamomea]
MNGQLQVMPEEWSRAMAVVAHPDDLEYGAASAVARWTRAGRSVAYVIVTDGEAGIDGLDPAEAGPVRQKEQIASAALVGVDDVTFLGRRDGVVETGLDLRRHIARHIRRFRPEVLVTATFEMTYGLADGQRILNQADHRAVGVAVLDAARDAGNRWVFPELLDEGYAPWTGVRHVYVVGASDPTHAADVTDTLEPGVASLRAHEAYLRGLGRDFDPETFVRATTATAGAALGVPHAVAFGQIRLQGV